MLVQRVLTDDGHETAEFATLAYAAYIWSPTFLYRYVVFTDAGPHQTRQDGSTLIGGQMPCWWSSREITIWPSVM